MNYTEKDLEDILYKKLSNGDISDIFDKGFVHYDPKSYEHSSVARQVNLDPYGIADIIVTRPYSDFIENVEIFERWIQIDIIELKVEPIKTKDINQVLRYKRAIERFQSILLENYPIEEYCPIQVKCILIGPSISGGHYVLNNLGYEGRNPLHLYTYDDSNIIDGIKFNYHESNTWFKEEDDQYIDRIRKGILYNHNIDQFSEVEKEILKKKKSEKNNG